MTNKLFNTLLNFNTEKLDAALNKHAIKFLNVVIDKRN